MSGTAPVYLDWNATAPLHPAAADAMVQAMGAPGNPSSIHRFGRSAKGQLEEARRAVAAAVGVGADRVAFCSGATEANNWALGALLPGAALLASAIEHDSVLAVARPMQHVPVSADGIVDLGALEAMLAAAGGPCVVALMLANNETGAVQPVAEAARLVHAAGGLLHCDAVQGLGKLPFSMEELGADALSLSGHKIGGPSGIGALVLRPGLALEPFLRGGGQERRQRAGTENLLGAIGFGAAAAALPQMLAEVPRLAALRDALQAAVLTRAPGAIVWAKHAPRLPGTLCVSIAGLAAQTQLMALDLAGVAVSSGSACSSGKVAPSHVLQAMGAAEALAGAAIRVGMGWSTPDSAVERLLAAWSPLLARSAGGGAAQATVAAAPFAGV